MGNRGEAGRITGDFKGGFLTAKDAKNAKGESTVAGQSALVAVFP